MLHRHAQNVGDERRCRGEPEAVALRDLAEVDRHEVEGGAHLFLGPLLHNHLLNRRPLDVVKLGIDALRRVEAVHDEGDEEVERKEGPKEDEGYEVYRGDRRAAVCHGLHVLLHRVRCAVPHADPLERGDPEEGQHGVWVGVEVPGRLEPRAGDQVIPLVEEGVGALGLALAQSAVDREVGAEVELERVERDPHHGEDGDDHHEERHGVGDGLGAPHEGDDDGLHAGVLVHHPQGAQRAEEAEDAHGLGPHEGGDARDKVGHRVKDGEEEHDKVHPVPAVLKVGRIPAAFCADEAKRGNFGEKLCEEDAVEDELAQEEHRSRDGRGDFIGGGLESEEDGGANDGAVDHRVKGGAHRQAKEEAVVGPVHPRDAVAEAEEVVLVRVLIELVGRNDAGVREAPIVPIAH
mmetsp:Transcript_7220/g.18428  ORF Transcript_7220/g.18428 Transcript_7220/m.18428 type:complete len:406 (-) Transcript_7220:1675-2892(-)